MSAIPRIIPAERTDCVVSAMHCFADVMIQMELEFAGRLDADRLARAIDLACDAEPVLGCRFVLAEKPFWERLERGERETFQTVSSPEEYEEVRDRSIDTTAGAQIRGYLYPTEGGDRLLLKVAHEIADAGGVKDIAEVISTIYRNLRTTPDFTPVPNLEGDRSARQILKQIPLGARPRILLNYLREVWGTIVPPGGHLVPVSERSDDRKVFLTRTLEAGAVERAVSRGKECGATINDILMAAVLRAHAAAGEWNGRSPLRLWTTIDNRRYLRTGRTGGICNLSAVEIVGIGNRLGSTFADTLSLVTALSKRRKASWFGLNTYIGIFPLLKVLSHRGTLKLMERTIRSYSSRGIVQAALTNMGRIVPERVTFDSPPVRAHLLVPPVYPPLLGLGLSGYGGSLTLSAGVYPSSSQKEIVARLMDRVICELPS